MAKTAKRKPTHPLMRISEAATLLGVARSTVRYRVWQELYSAEEIGGVTFLIRSEIEAAAKAAAKKKAA